MVIDGSLLKWGGATEEIKMRILLVSGSQARPCVLMRSRAVYLLLFLAGPVNKILDKSDRSFHSAGLFIERCLPSEHLISWEFILEAYYFPRLSIITANALQDHSCLGLMKQGLYRSSFVCWRASMATAMCLVRKMSHSWTSCSAPTGPRVGIISSGAS